MLLHEGLGSVALWKTFPAALARATGCRLLVYSRVGYGRSTPLAGPRAADYMHIEALHLLPALLDRLKIDKPLLFGHSDGASIALLYAGAGDRPVAGLIVLAPHLFVEPLSLAAIARAQTAYGNGLRERLAVYHADVDGAFWGWNDIWLSEAFRDWNIEFCLAGIDCPVLAVQGEDDEYGSFVQIDTIARQVSDTQLLKLARCGHSPHRDRPRAVLTAAAEFVARLDAVAKTTTAL